MLKIQKPTKQEQNDFVLHLYFGFNEDPLDSCIKRAYLDMARTLHGLAKHENREILTPDAAKLLKLFLNDLVKIQTIKTQDEFDSWHHMICNSLIMSYQVGGYMDFSYGQAQKWLNMTMKYIYVFGDDYFPDYTSVYNFCHMPLDNYILDALYKKGAPKLGTSWSTTKKVNYLKIQNWIRDAYPEVAPLAVEFHLWNEAMKNSTKKLTKSEQES